MNSDFKLKGCWQSNSISNMGVSGGTGSSTFSSNELCFDKNGRFSNDSGTTISGNSNGDMARASRSTQGTYRINGNSIVLNYADGRTVETAFGAYRYDTENIFAISVGRQILH